MVRPIDPQQTEDYIDRVDREGGTDEGKPMEGATHWPLGPPSMLQRQAIADGSYAMDMGGGDEDDSKGQRFLALTGSTNLGRVRSGLRKGVVNYTVPWASETCAIDRNRQVPTLDYLATIPDDVLNRMAARVAKLTSVSETDVGKSGPPSDQPGTPDGIAAPAASAGA